MAEPRNRDSIARLPDALFVGPQRAGTTWIHEFLAARDDVALPRAVKETYFFDLRWERGPAWYAGFFPPTDRPRVVEVGPSYFHSPEAPARVARLLGPIPVVCTLRDPAERTHSLWTHMRRYGMTDLSFGEAVDALPELVGSSRYTTHLLRWRDAVGQGNVHVLFMEDLRRNRQAYSDAISRVLGLAPRAVPARLASRVNEGSLPRSHHLARLGWKASRSFRDAGMHGVVNASKQVGLHGVFFGSPGARKPPPLGSGERARLQEILRPEIEGLERLLGVDLAAWRT